jgi:hypothetical protein
MFRHKLAHLGYLPVVFETATKPNRFVGQPQRRVTWTVYASKRKHPIELVENGGPAACAGQFATINQRVRYPDCIVYRRPGTGRPYLILHKGA